MNKLILFGLSFIFTVVLSTLYAQELSNQKGTKQEKNKEKEVVQKDTKDKISDKSKEIIVTKIDTAKAKSKSVLTVSDTIQTVENLKFKPYKKKAHASYYSDKLNGKRTASGKKFDNSKYTAAHKKLPFGTKIRVTNEANGKSVIVEVTDRGPFSKVREIDLTKKAFKELVENKNSGSVIVTIEVLEE